MIYLSLALAVTVLSLSGRVTTQQKCPAPRVVGPVSADIVADADKTCRSVDRCASWIAAVTDGSYIIECLPRERLK